MADYYQELQERVDRLEMLVREAREIIQQERDDLAEGCAIPSVVLGPAQADCRIAIETMDLWLARAKAEGA